MKKLRAVIIEDMKAALDLLKADLAANLPEVEVVGSAGSVVEGLKLIKEQRPNILFLDIELKDGNGFDLLEILDDREIRVIFTTASDQHAIRAFRFSAIDYLLKPIQTGELIDAVRKVKPVTTEKVDVLLDHWSGDSVEQRITLSNADEVKIVSVAQIIRCESDSNYTSFYFEDESKFLVSKTLKHFEKLLEPLGFFRSHQSHLVNMDHVQAFVKSEGGYLQLTQDMRVPVAVRKRNQLMVLLDA